MTSWLLACAVKAGLLLAASWLGAAVLRRGTAAARHQIWTLGVAGAVVLPLLCWVVPSLAPGTTTLTGGAVAVDAVAMVGTRGPEAGAATSWPAWLAFVWIAGALVVALRALRGHLAARTLVREAVAHGFAGGIPLRRSDAIVSPMTIGILRPCVLLPAAADAWSPERRRTVLVHELGHVRRRDTLVQLVAQLACALYWWNPLAWLAAARLRREREHACDDLVLGAGILPSRYAADLLDVARAIATDASAAICMVDPSWTEARLARILDATVPRRRLRARFHVAACGLALAGLATLACTSSPPPTSHAPLGTLAVGEPFLRDWDMTRPPTGDQGAVDLGLVATEVERQRGALEACYQRRLAAKPGLAGTVLVHATIATTGQVLDQCITTDTVGDEAIVACVNELVERGRFPTPRGGAVDVSIPFVFTAGG